MSTLEFWSEAVRLGPNERVRGATNARKMQKWRFHGKVHHVQRSRSPPPVLARQKIASVEFATFDASSARSEEPVEPPDPSRQQPTRGRERATSARRLPRAPSTAGRRHRKRRGARLLALAGGRRPQCGSLGAPAPSGRLGSGGDGGADVYGRRGRRRLLHFANLAHSTQHLGNTAGVHPAVAVHRCASLRTAGCSRLNAFQT